MSTWEEKIKNTRVMRLLKVWLSEVILPGFHGVSLYDSLSFFVQQIFSPRFTVAARAVSFSFLMAMPPFLLFLFTLIPYLPLSTDSLIASLDQTVGMITQNKELQASFSELMNNFFLHKKDVLLSFSVFMTLFFSSNGLLGLMISFDRNFAGFTPKVWYRKRLTALLLTVVFFVVIILSFSLMIFQAWIFDYLGLHDWIIIGKILQYLIIALMLILTISLIYRYGPNTNSRWPLLTPGSVVASVLIIVLTVGFFYGVNNLINYNQIYGSVGTLIIFLVWLLAMSRILLIGFELNVSIFVNKELRAVEFDNETKELCNEI